MTRDLAAFREADLLAVHGPVAGRTCFQTARSMRDGQPIDCHHIFGRGNKGSEDRRLHSSIFNCALLRRDIHHGPMRDKKNQREAYLDETISRVMEAIATKRYELREEDRAFLARYRPDVLGY